MTMLRVLLLAFVLVYSTDCAQKLRQEKQVSETISLNPKADSLKETDYKAGPIVLWSHVSKVLLHLPSPNLVRSENEPQTGDKFSIYEFDSLTIQTNGWGLIDCFMFSRSTFKTARGVGVGDSVRKIVALYGEPTKQGFCATDLEGNEDGVLAYCEGSSVEGIAFYFKKSRITRITVGSCVRP